MKVLKFILTWQFWTSLVSIALIVYAMVWGVFAWLSFYTNHGKQVEVPNVMNISLDQAVQKLEEERLDYEIDTSKYDPQYKPYQILDVYPIIGSNVKEGRRIFIRANAKTWKSVALPNIVGRSKYLAFSQLDLVGLQISDTVYEPNLAVNTVLRVLYKGKEIQPGMMLPRLSGLTLVLGQKLAQNVKVPTLIGLDEAAAANVIKENLFTVGNVTYDNPDQKENARVYYQIPAPNTNYDQGQIIDIYLSAKSMDSLKSKIRELDYTFNRQYVKDTVTGQISSNQENPKISVPSKPAAEEAQKPKTPPKKVISE